MACFWKDTVAATQICDLGAPVMPTDITLWGYPDSSIFLRTNNFNGWDAANVEVLGAGAVTLLGYWPTAWDGSMYTSSAPTVAQPVDTSLYGTFVSAEFSLSSNADGWTMGYEASIPESNLLALFDVDGELHIGAVANMNII